MPITSPFTVNTQTIDGNLTVNDDGSGTYGKVIAGPTNTPMMALQASTGTTGYTMVNGTGTVISWVVPNDGQMHRAWLLVNLDVTSAETGGATVFNVTLNDGTVISSFSAIAAGQGTGLHTFATPLFAKAGTTVSFAQSTALTVGAAVAWAEIWGS